MKRRAGNMLCVAVGRRDLNVLTVGRRLSPGQQVGVIFIVESAEAKYR
ncbi:hypothetical protein ES707_22477 [subsurface metagenome]